MSEYPKILYLNGEPKTGDAKSIHVFSSEEEATANEQGFRAAYSKPAEIEPEPDKSNRRR